MTDDLELVRKFAEEHSQEAFAQIVSRHVNLVYSAALRQVRDPHMADEITQAVFIVLSRKAASLNDKTVLSGWLYRTARYIAADALKMQRRRQKHEQQALQESQLVESSTETLWEQLLPCLDDAMAQLRDKERDAVVLRFFENKSLREVGKVLGLEERTAQKRIHRAVEKLRIYFSKRGVVATSSVIAGLITTNSVQAAPAALAKTASLVALGNGVAVGNSTLALAEHGLNLMAWFKVKTVLLAIAVVIATSTTGVVAYQNNRLAADEFVWSETRLDLLPPVVMVRSAKTPSPPISKRTGIAVSNALQPARIVFSALMPNGTNDFISRPLTPNYNQSFFKYGEKVRGQNQSLTLLLAVAYDVTPQRIFFLEPKLNEHFDFISTTTSARMSLQMAIQKQLRLNGRVESRLADCLRLQRSSQHSLALKTPKDIFNICGIFSPGKAEMNSYTLDNLSDELETVLKLPIVNKTALDGKFDMRFIWDASNTSLHAFNQALQDQLGLELVPAREAIKMVVIEKSK